MGNTSIKISSKELIYQIIDNKIDKIKVNKYSFSDTTNEDFNKFINALKLNKSIKTFKFEECKLSQEQYDKIFSLLQFKKNINKFYFEDFNIVFYPELKKINTLLNNFNEINQLDIKDDYKNEIINFQNKIKIMQDILSKKTPLYNLIQNNNLKSLAFNIDYDVNQFFSEQILFYILKNNKNITSIDLSNLFNLKKIMELLNFNSNISNLSINCFFINDTDFENFCKYIEQNKSLKQLDIKTVKKTLVPDNKSYFIKETLINALINNQYINSIIFRGYSFIIECEEIDWNLIIKLLQNNNRIKKLFFKHISTTKIKDINIFLEYLQTNNSLQKLKIKCIDYSPRLLALIIKNNKTLEYLDLSDSKFSNIDLMFEYLKTNTTLKYLNLKDILFSDKYYTKEIVNIMIKEVLEYNKNIKIDY